MKIAVLGAAGFVGTNLCYRLRDRYPESEIYAIDSMADSGGSDPRSWPKIDSGLQSRKGSILDQALLEWAISGADVIFNCAAQTSHPVSNRFPLLDTETNSLGALRVLECVKNTNPGAVVVYPSSSTAVGKPTTTVVDETHAEHPLDIYSANKCVAEKFHEIYANAHGLKTVILRFSNLYGPFGRKTADFGFFNYFINLAWAGKEIEIFGEGSQIRNVLHVNDACDLMIDSSKNTGLVGKTFFATGPFHHSLREISECVVSTFGRGSIKFIPWPQDRLKIEVGSVTYSSSALVEKTGWQPKISLKRGLELTKAALESRDVQ